MVSLLAAWLYKVAWPLISNFSCPSASTNQGWRYYLFTMGGIMMVMWFFRLFGFNLQESPKYLMGCGRDEEAVASAHKVAAINGKTSNLTVARLKEAEILVGGSNQNNAKMDTSAKAFAMRKLSKFDANHVKPLFATPKLVASTSILIIFWGEH